jgi:hypothetical protein
MVFTQSQGSYPVQEVTLDGAILYPIGVGKNGDTLVLAASHMLQLKDAEPDRPVIDSYTAHAKPVLQGAAFAASERYYPLGNPDQTVVVHIVILEKAQNPS